MGIIKKKERERMAHIILCDIIDNIQELAIRAEKGTLNDAYHLAWQVCITSEIEDSLKKLKQDSPKN